MTGPTVALTKTGSGAAKLQAALQKLSQSEVYVGIPEGDTREHRLLTRAAKAKPHSNRQKRLLKAADQDITNAQLLWVFSKGSKLRNIPARPVIEPAIESKDNKADIADELKLAAASMLKGEQTEASKHLARAGQVGMNAAREWFTDPRNGWARNSPRTIKAKGSDRPGINIGEMRRAITFVVKEQS